MSHFKSHLNTTFYPPCLIRLDECNKKALCFSQILICYYNGYVIVATGVIKTTLSDGTQALVRGLWILSTSMPSPGLIIT